MFILRMKIKTSKMPKRTSHGHRTASPWWAKDEVELVVLYERRASNTSLVSRQLALQLQFHFL